MSKQQVGALVAALLLIAGIAVAIYIIFGGTDIPPCMRCEMRMLPGGKCEFLIETRPAGSDRQWHLGAIEVIHGESRTFQPLFDGPVASGPQTRTLDTCPEISSRILFELYEGGVSQGFIPDVITVVRAR